MSDAFDDLLAFGIGKALFSGSTAQERERERVERERQHKELLAALQRQARLSKKSSRPAVITIHCPFCNKRVPVAYFNGHRGCSECNRQIEGPASNAPSQSACGGGECICHNCFGLVQFTAETRGKWSRCPHCKAKIIMEEGGIVLPPSMNPKKKTAANSSAPLPVAGKPKELKVSCPFCDGHVSFVVAEAGGETIPCPHCQNHIVLPNG